MKGDTKYIPVGSRVRLLYPIIDLAMEGIKETTVVNYLPGVVNCYEIEVEWCDEWGDIWIKRAFVSASDLEVICPPEDDPNLISLW